MLQNIFFNWCTGLAGMGVLYCTSVLDWYWTCGMGVLVLDYWYMWYLGVLVLDYWYMWYLGVHVLSLIYTPHPLHKLWERVWHHTLIFLRLYSHFFNMKTHTLDNGLRQLRDLDSYENQCIDLERIMQGIYFVYQGDLNSVVVNNLSSKVFILQQWGNGHDNNKWHRSASWLHGRKKHTWWWPSKCSQHNRQRLDFEANVYNKLHLTCAVSASAWWKYGRTVLTTPPSGIHIITLVNKSHVLM